MNECEDRRILFEIEQAKRSEPKFEKFVVQVIDAEGIEEGSGSNNRKRHLQQNSQYLLSEITSNKLYVANLIVYLRLCQNAPGRKFKKVKVP